MWLLVVVLAVVMFVALLSFTNGNKANVSMAVGVADDGTTASGFEGGAGTARDPYLIATPMQLRYLSATSSLWGGNYYYKLVDGIEVTSTEWTPIGSTPSFVGTFDGNGKTITFSQTVSGDEITPVGLFANLGSESCVQNLGIDWHNLSAYNSSLVGGIAGSVSESATIKNCFVDGSINASYFSGSDIGGIVGSNSGTIQNCYNMSSISASATVADPRVVYNGGGIAGYSSGTISNCYNTGNISISVTSERFGSVTAYAGGIAGSATSIKDCFTLLSGSYSVSASADESYSGAITTSSSGVEYSYYNKGSGLGTLDVELSSKLNDATDFGMDGELAWSQAWDFDKIWGINASENSGLPVFRAFYPFDYTITYQYDRTGENAEQPNVIVGFQVLFDGPAPYQVKLAGNDLFTNADIEYTQWKQLDNGAIYTCGSEYSLTQSVVLCANWLYPLVDVEIVIALQTQSEAGIVVYLVQNTNIIKQFVVIGAQTQTISCELEPNTEYTIIVFKPYTWQVEYSDNGVLENGNFVFATAESSSDTPTQYTITVSGGSIPNNWWIV